MTLVGNSTMNTHTVLLLGLLGPMLVTRSAEFTYSALNLPVPDGSSAGLAHVQRISATELSGPIANLSVSLSIDGLGPSGAFNGDLYVTLQHESGAFAVLLNRPGRTLGNAWGYGDNGLDVTFAGVDGAPDIHTYRLTLGGPPAGPLTGTWAADGRIADPNEVTESSPRLASLGSFLGTEASGTWMLFVADLEPGGKAVLESWSLDISLVPEPTHWAFVVGLGLLTWRAWRRCRSGEKPIGSHLNS